jgi:hypothetical protein
MTDEKFPPLDRLKKLGFQKVGAWKLAGLNLTVDLAERDQRGNFIYAFVIGDKVKFLEYSRLPLEARMDAYKHTDHRYASTFQPMNKRLREKVLVALEEGETVEIWAFYPGEEHTFKGYRVDMAAGLFDSLVKAFSPEWNGYLR